MSRQVSFYTTIATFRSSNRAVVCQVIGELHPEKMPRSCCVFLFMVILRTGCMDGSGELAGSAQVLPQLRQTGLNTWG